jgi:hypothetical protein
LSERKWLDFHIPAAGDRSCFMCSTDRNLYRLEKNLTRRSLFSSGAGVCLLYISQNSAFFPAEGVANSSAQFMLLREYNALCQESVCFVFILAFGEQVAASPDLKERDHESRMHL